MAENFELRDLEEPPLHGSFRYARSNDRVKSKKWFFFYILLVILIVSAAFIVKKITHESLEKVATDESVAKKIYTHHPVIFNPNKLRSEYMTFSSAQILFA